MPHVIEVSHLVKRYKKSDKNAVDDVSFYVEEGSFFSLLGPNGAGKTTTISILTTLLAPTSGTVTLAGFDIQTQSSHVRENIGVIFQNPSLDLNLTAEENIRFHANLYQLFPYRPSFALMERAYQERVMNLAEVLDLQNDIFKPVKSFSGGMKRKLEIVRSLMHKPRVLFLDEPTTGLDPISRKNLWQYLQQIRTEERITIFLTTHYLEEAERSDFICIMNHGKLAAKGTPHELKQNLVKQYVVMDAEDRDKLKTELKKHKFSVSGRGPFQIAINAQTAQETIQKIKMPLSQLSIHDPTLEDAYIEIIGNPGHERA